jgi:hypothetical protein
MAKPSMAPQQPFLSMDQSHFPVKLLTMTYFKVDFNQRPDKPASINTGLQVPKTSTIYL